MSKGRVCNKCQSVKVMACDHCDSQLRIVKDELVCNRCGFKEWFRSNWYYKMARTRKQRETAIKVLRKYESNERTKCHRTKKTAQVP